MDIKLILDQKAVEKKWGTSTTREIQLLVQEIHDRHEECTLDLGTREKEMEAMKRKIKRYNVAQLGDIPLEWDDRTMQILVCQIGGCASVETREIKIAATERLIRKYDVNLCLFMESTLTGLRWTHRLTLRLGSKRRKERQGASQHTTLRKTTLYLGNINREGRGCCAGRNTYSTPIIRLLTHKV